MLQLVQVMCVTLAYHRTHHIGHLPVLVSQVEGSRGAAMRGGLALADNGGHSSAPRDARAGTARARRLHANSCGAVHSHVGHWHVALVFVRRRARHLDQTVWPAAHRRRRRVHHQTPSSGCSRLGMPHAVQIVRLRGARCGRLALQSWSQEMDPSVASCRVTSARCSF